jgi:sugar lactone lactonase YvrE
MFVSRGFKPTTPLTRKNLHPIQDSEGVYMSMTRGKRRVWIALLMVLFSLTIVGTALAAPFPDVIPLPNGFQPEGIAAGTGTTFYVGSIPTGAIYEGDFLTGQGSILVPAQEGRNAIGLKFDQRTGLLFVAGGPSGYAYIYDTATGESVAAVQLSTDPSFINDVVITRDAVYFTNSFQPEIYRIPLESGGELPSSPQVQTIPLTGDYVFTPGAFNANGIAATPDGKTLIIVNSSEGALYRVDPLTGVATRIDLGGGNVQFGDGILLQGKTLYVVQNQLNQVAVVRLNSDLSAGTVESTLTNQSLRVPTTIARFGDALYAVNARFGTPPTSDTEYEVVRVPIQ